VAGAVERGSTAPGGAARRCSRSRATWAPLAGESVELDERLDGRAGVELGAAA
jgi:hypothetical protein